MRLPNAAIAVIDAAKVRDYLLSHDHRDGRSKARFFGRLGFSQAGWLSLRDQLLAVARDGEAELVEPGAYGQKYVVRGMIQGPTGRAAAVVTVWIVLRGEEAPRFVTAYPGEAFR
jgi:hypothetical protein